jgi:hypothetical protein
MKSSFLSILLLQRPFLSRLSHISDMREPFLSSRLRLRHNKSTAPIYVLEPPVYSKSTLEAVHRPLRELPGMLTAHLPPGMVQVLISMAGVAVSGQRALKDISELLVCTFDTAVIVVHDGFGRI